MLSTYDSHASHLNLVEVESKVRCLMAAALAGRIVRVSRASEEEARSKLPPALCQLACLAVCGRGISQGARIVASKGFVHAACAYCGGAL